MKQESSKGSEVGRQNVVDQPFRSTRDPADLFAEYILILRQLRSQCPWDRDQTHASMTHLLIEEAYEAVQAIENDDFKGLKLELGDLLLHVVFHAIMAAETDTFDLTDVIEASIAKLISRHPHVFGDVVAENAADVLRNWEAIKRSEESRSSLLDGVPESLPALLAAYRMQEKVGSVGFDFASLSDCAEKVIEEAGEFRDARSEEEFGDLLFSLVNYARHMGLMPDRALRMANARFRARFQYVESRVNVHRSPSLEAMERYWNEAKRREKSESGHE